MRSLATLCFALVVVSCDSLAAEIYDNGPCCADVAIFSDREFAFLSADDVALAAPTTIGGIRFFGLYADSGGSASTNSVPDSDDFLFQVFADDGGQPGALLGTSALTGTRVATGQRLGRTTIRWFRYDMNLAAPIAISAGIVWVAVSNDTSTDVDDDWAWGLTNESPQLAVSDDDGVTWLDSGRNGNLAFSLFDAAGVTSLALTTSVLDEADQPVANAEVGSRLLYRVAVTNDSGETADGLTVESLLSRDVVLVDVTSVPSVEPTVVERTIAWNVGALAGTPPDNTFVADVTVDVTAGAADSSVVQQAIIAAVDEPFTTGAVATASFDAMNSEAVSIDKQVARSGSPTGVAAAGDRLTYTLTVTNDGVAARDVIVTDPLPGDASYVGDSGGYDPSTGIWTAGTLGTAEPDKSATLSIDVDVLPSAAGFAVTNVATVTSLDGSATRIPAAATVSVFGSDLALEAAGVLALSGQTITEAQAGTTAVFRFRLANNGPEATTSATRVTFTELYAPFLDYTGVSRLTVYDSPDFSGPSREPTGATGSTCTVSLNVWTCPVERPGGQSTLAAGETISFEVAIITPLVSQDLAVDLAIEIRGADVDPVSDNGATSQAVAILANPSSLVGGQSRDSRCFIATAAYGSYLEPEVQVLRDFRDEYLMTHAPGRAFVAWYYTHSPAVADVIADSAMLRALTRAALTPLIYGVKYPLPASALLLLATVSLAHISRRRQRARVASLRPDEFAQHIK